MIKYTYYYLTLLLIISGCIGTCQATASLGESIINLIQKPGTTKKQVLDLISSIKAETPEARSVLAYQPKAISRRASAPPLLENIVCKISPELARESQTPSLFIASETLSIPEGIRKSEISLSYDDLLEICKELWKLDPAYASSLKGSATGHTDSTDLDQAPLLHKLIAKLFDARSIVQQKETTFFKSYINFIIESYPQALMVKNEKGNTCLHYVQSFIDTKRKEELVAQELMEDFLKVEDVKGFIDLQNNEGSTALHLAITTKPAYAATLLDKGANPFIPNKEGKHALALLTESIDKDPLNSPNAICTLLRSKTYRAETTTYLTSLRTKNQESILHLFAKAGHQEGLILLKNNGVNLQDPVLTQKDVFGKTPLDYMKAKPSLFPRIIIKEKRESKVPERQVKKETHTTNSSRGNTSQANTPQNDSQTGSIHWTIQYLGVLSALSALGLAIWHLSKEKKKATPYEESEEQIPDERLPKMDTYSQTPT